MATANTPERTPEEIKANLAKTRADIIKTQAEARKLTAEAETAEAEAAKAKLELKKLQADRKRVKAGDSENHVYRFNGGVDKASVAKCRCKLTQWSRLSPGCDMEIVFASPGGGITSGFELFDYIQHL